MALVQTSANDAIGSALAVGGALDAAVAAAHRAALSRLLPAQQPAIDAAYAASLSAVPEGPKRNAGIAAGEQAARAVLAKRADDQLIAESYRPHAVAGIYVPTALPAALQ